MKFTVVCDGVAKPVKGLQNLEEGFWQVIDRDDQAFLGMIFFVNSQGAKNLEDNYWRGVFIMHKDDKGITSPWGPSWRNTMFQKIPGTKATITIT